MLGRYKTNPDEKTYKVQQSQVNMNIQLPSFKLMGLFPNGINFYLTSTSVYGLLKKWHNYRVSRTRVASLLPIRIRTLGEQTIGTPSDKKCHINHTAKYSNRQSFLHYHKYRTHCRPKLRLSNKHKNIT